jgi:hypothetical protein
MCKLLTVTDRLTSYFLSARTGVLFYIIVVICDPCLHFTGCILSGDEFKADVSTFMR